MILKNTMACNGALNPPSKISPPKIGNPPQKKHEDVKLMHKPLIQHNS